MLIRMLSHAINVKENGHSKNAFSWRYTLFLLIIIRFKTNMRNISLLAFLVEIMRVIFSLSVWITTSNLFLTEYPVVLYLSSSCECGSSFSVNDREDENTVITLRAGDPIL